VKSFAQALSDSGDIPLTQLPPKVVMGDTVRVKITQDELESGISDCRMNLHGRITLATGDTPLITQALKNKLCSLWPTLKEWNVLPLGRGFFEFHFGSVEDMRKIWALGVVNLKPGILRFSCWTKAFKPHNQAQTHAHIWVRLMQLPQEYWRKKTLFEIASALGTPLTIDEATLSRRFGIFARVLVNVDMSSILFDSVVVESEGLALPIVVQYERQPLFCVQCNMLGHSTQNCWKLHKDYPNKIVKKTTAEVPLVQQHPIEALANNTQTTKNTCVTYEFIPDSEALDREPLNLTQAQDSAIDDEAITAILEDQSLDLTLALHNSFTILEEEIVLPAGEAVTDDKEDLLIVLSASDVNVSKGKVDLPHSSNIEKPNELKKKPQSSSVDSGQQVLVHGSERLSFLRPSSSSSLQGNNTEAYFPQCFLCILSPSL